MKPLQPIPQCVNCLTLLARDVVRLTSSKNPEFVEKAELIVRNNLEDAENKELSSPQITNRILREIRKMIGIDDPYSDFKAQELAQARLIFSHLENHVDHNLRSLVSLAVLGNSLDFFKNPEQALAEIPDLFNNGVSFYRDHIDQLESVLATRPEKLLYLTDNSGEIYFDSLLYEYLKQYSQKTYLVVKGGPALNDLTRVELEAAGLESRFDIVTDTGTDGAGIDWENVSREFMDLFSSADLIVSKGMANFETLYPKRISTPCFYLFKVKCEPIQNYIEAPINSFMALWKEGSSSSN
jgi:damage-control phosphatase, subfamily I